MHLPFTKQHKVYTTDVPLKKLEDKFIDMAGSGSGGYDKIYCSIADLDQKKYSFYVVIQGTVDMLPFLRTKLVAKLLESEGKIKIETITKTNPLYLFIIGFITVFNVAGITISQLQIKQIVITLISTYLAIGITDIISKKILQGTFERLLK